MADRAEMFSLSTFHSLSPPGGRPPQDISLEEFDDEDLSEITDDCGIGLNYDSDPCEKDSLSLGRSEHPHPICSFQDDFQEFEMIDENEEEEEEEDGEGEVEDGGHRHKAPPSPPLIPSPSAQEPHKPRPTTLNLTSLGTQDSLNNNGGFSPPRATWQETLLPSPPEEPHNAHRGPHVCTADGHREEQCGPPSDYDCEGNRSGEGSEASTGPPPAPGGSSPSSDPGIEADLRSHSSGSRSRSRGRGRGRGLRSSEELSSPGSGSGSDSEDAEGELAAAGPGSGGRGLGHMISSISETELDLSSDGGSSSGRSSHLTNSIEEASSPASDPEAEAESGPDPEPREAGLAPSPRPPETSAVPAPAPAEPSSGLRRPAYLPVGPGGAGASQPAGPDEANSEYESGSESEPDVSEDADSPWLLSNLVSRLISEGSSPISCPAQCLSPGPGHPAPAPASAPAAAPPAPPSPSDTISPTSASVSASELGRGPDGGGRGSRSGPGLAFEDTEEEEEEEEDDDEEEEEEQEPQSAPGAPASIELELVDMETLCGGGGGGGGNSCGGGSALQPPGRPPAPVRPPPAQPGPFLFLSNPTRDTITPVWGAPGRAARASRACSAACSEEEDEDEDEEEEDEDEDEEEEEGDEEEEDEAAGVVAPRGLNLGPGPAAARDASLVYDAVKYTLVVDEHTQLELVSLRRCASGLSHDSPASDSGSDSGSEDPGSPPGSGAPGARDLRLGSRSGAASPDSPDSPDLTFSKKFLNVFVNSTSRSSSTESFGLFSCMINGEEREQTHRAVFRFIPRHSDEVELDVDDPVLVEAEEDDFWFRGFNMRTGERGIFPAFYAHAVPGPTKDLLGGKRSPCWVERFNVQFLGSVEVPCHQGNGILCAAMQKIATARKLTVHLRPPASCDLQISLRGVKLSLSGGGPEFERCSHFFQMKNISFCGCHPRNSCYFGFITKHPVLSRFACHVFVSQESMRPVAQSVGRAFLEYYQEHLEYACPTEDIYLE
ncbi:C-Jun-amino-terminal kinase-interacting protein 2 isoform X1 [Monodelphis domestica]|uniref:C-Jun-amino-terminal kinase-interacting protein 2 isoform X1 n=1 Tax=Monodelphis domestica TaxID=13616 RepID=UPI0024E23802|nr:C-Jun-amino-terminal kinase-interacting protein 2 isoform X1 [Monodelphis domestica]